MRSLHAVAFSKYLFCFKPTNVISFKMQPQSVKTRWKRASQRCFKSYIQLIFASWLATVALAFNSNNVLKEWSLVAVVQVLVLRDLEVRLSGAHLGSISSTFLVRFFRTNVGFGSFFLATCTLPKRHSYEKFVRKTLMKLTPSRPPNWIGLNFCLFWKQCLNLKTQHIWEWKSLAVIMRSHLK